MSAPRSLLFNLAFFGWTALALAVSTPVLALPPVVTVRAQTLWARGVLALMRWIVGIRVEIRGQAPAAGAIIAAKHQSAWDTLIWHVIVRDPAVVMKKELLAIPLYGWYCRKSRQIAVDRAGGPAALKAMVRAAQAAVEAGRPVIIFPEGTRTAPGETLPYQPGVAALYRGLGVAVVPVAVNSGLYWPRRSFHKRPGTLVLEFLAPIAPGLKRRPFMAELEARIEAGTAALVAEGRHSPSCG
jgi:1-acyl-sn-glycerol-3-phosphate acyltransferase